MVKEEKGFEAKIKAMSNRGCACITGMLEKRPQTSIRLYVKGVVKFLGQIGTLSIVMIVKENGGF